MKIFGFELGKSTKEQKKDEIEKSPINPSESAGALLVDRFMRNAADSLYYTALTENELITRYRDMSLYPHCDSAIDDIINELLSSDDKEPSIEMDFTLDSKIPYSIKKKITDEFKTVLKLLNFKEDGYKIARYWYVDGRLNYHALISPERPEEGLKELRYIDPRQIKRIMEIEKLIDPNTGMEYVANSQEYFVFNEMGFGAGMPEQQAHTSIPFFNPHSPDMYSCYRLTKDSIVYCDSGIVDKYSNTVYSHLHKAMRTLNQLKMMEDASVIYRITRAPERRVFRIDVGGLPHKKAVQYVQSLIDNFRNNISYNPETGETYSDKQFYSMQEDFWLPVKEGSQGSSIDTLPGGQNLGEIEDIEYFQRKFYQTLNVPIGRLDSQNNFNVGRVTEITRDEVKFYKFIVRLRQQFSKLFLEILKKQLLLKEVLTPDDWEEWKDDLYFIFSKDNYFGELKEQEILSARMETLQMLDPYIGKYFSHQYVRDVILQQSDRLQKIIDKQIKQEQDDYLEKTEDRAEIDLATAEAELEMETGSEKDIFDTDPFDARMSKDETQRNDIIRDTRKANEGIFDNLESFSKTVDTLLLEENE